jgi:hypothetical protein
MKRFSIALRFLLPYSPDEVVGPTRYSSDEIGIHHSCCRSNTLTCDLSRRLQFFNTGNDLIADGGITQS